MLVPYRTHASHHPHATAPAPPQPGPACSAGVLARRTKWRRSGGRPQGIPGGAPPPGPRATWGVRPCVGPGRGERALGQIDAVPRAWTRFRPGKRQPERRSPALERVHQPRGTLTQPRARSAAPGHVHPAQSAFAYTRARSPEGACTRRSSLARPPGCGGGARNRRAAHSSSQPTVDDADGQTASSPRGQQHVSTGHEDLQEGDADTPTHTPAEEPPQPNLPQRPRQDTPGTRPRTPNPPTQRSTTRTRRPRSRAQQRAPPVLTTNKYRSREQ